MSTGPPGLARLRLRRLRPGAARGCESLSGSGHFTDEPAGSLSPCGRLMDEPSEVSGVRKSHGFSEEWCEGFFLTAVLPETVSLLVFYFYHFFLTNSPPSLLLSVDKLCRQLFPLIALAWCLFRRSAGVLNRRTSV